MKRYRDRCVGALVVVLLIAALVVLLPSRGTLPLNRFTRAPERRVTWVEVPPFAAVRVTPATPAPAASPPTRPAPPTRALATSATSEAFTVDFGTFADVKDIEEAERRLKETGLDTVRYRDRTTVAVYAVKIGAFSTAEEATDALRKLQSRHPALPLGRLELDAAQGITIVPDATLRLRDAVALAETFRREGFPVRLKSTGGGEPVFGLRLKGRHAAAAAHTKARELESQGFRTSVVGMAAASSP